MKIVDQPILAERSQRPFYGSKTFGSWNPHAHIAEEPAIASEARHGVIDTVVQRFFQAGDDLLLG